MSIKLLVNAKGGPGSGNFGHAGRPGEVGGSGPGGGGGKPKSGKPGERKGAVTSDEHHSTAKSWLDKQRKRDLGSAFTADEAKQLEAAGFRPVEGHNAYIRRSGKTPFADSFSMIQAYKPKVNWQGERKPRVFTATHFNKDEKYGWMDSSEHGYSEDRGGQIRFGTGDRPEDVSGLSGIITQVDSYQS